MIAEHSDQFLDVFVNPANVENGEDLITALLIELLSGCDIVCSSISYATYC